MAIQFNVGMKRDYSYLFKGFSGSSSVDTSFLSDYASIKNGSYGKLMKAYYAKDNTNSSVKSIAETKTTNSASKDSAETIKNIQSAADGLKESADKLISEDKTSVFHDTTDKIYEAANSFVEDYNQLIKNTSGAVSESVRNRTTTLRNLTDINASQLSKIGITVNDDKTLSINKDAFTKADEDTVKTLLNGKGSYAYRVSAQSSLIDFAATQEASKANTYTQSGTYGNTLSTGSIFDYGF